MERTYIFQNDYTLEELVIKAVSELSAWNKLRALGHREQDWSLVGAQG